MARLVAAVLGRDHPRQLDDARDAELAVAERVDDLRVAQHLIAFFLFGAQGGAVPFVIYFLGLFLLLATPPAGATTALFVLLALPLFLHRLWLGLAVASAAGEWTFFWHVFLHGSG